MDREGIGEAGQGYRQMDWTPDKVARFWAWQSQYPDAYFAHRFGGRIVRRLAPYLPRSGEILDYGCGTGDLMEWLLAAGYRVAGVDFSETSATATDQRLRGRPNFLGAGPVEDAVAQGRSFDAVICTEIIEHLYDEQLAELFRSIKALAKPGAPIILTTPNEEDLEKSFVYCPDSDVVFHRWQHVRSWSAETLSHALRQAGLRPSHVFTTDFAVTGRRYPVWRLKRAVKRVLGRPNADPHLVSVCRHDGATK